MKIEQMPVLRPFAFSNSTSIHSVFVFLFQMVCFKISLHWVRLMICQKKLGSSSLYFFGPSPLPKKSIKLIQALLSRLSDEPATSLLRVAGLKALFEDDNWDVETCGNEPTKGWQIWWVKSQKSSRV